MPIALTWWSSLKAQHCQPAQFFSAVFPQLWGILHWAHHSQGMMDASFSAFWYQQAGRGITPWSPEQLWTWCTELRIAHCPGPLTLGTVAWNFTGNKASESVSDWGHPEVLHSRPWMLTATTTLCTQRFSWEPLLFCKFKIMRDTFLSLLS